MAPDTASTRRAPPSSNSANAPILGEVTNLMTFFFPRSILKSLGFSSEVVAVQIEPFLHQNMVPPPAVSLGMPRMNAAFVSNAFWRVTVSIRFLLFQCLRPSRLAVVERLKLLAQMMTLENPSVPMTRFFEVIGKGTSFLNFRRRDSLNLGSPSVFMALLSAPVSGCWVGRLFVSRAPPRAYKDSKAPSAHEPSEQTGRWSDLP